MHALTDRHQWTQEGYACRGRNDEYLNAAFISLIGNLAHNHGAVSPENRADYHSLFMAAAKSPLHARVIEPLTITLADGRTFPQCDGNALCWSIGMYNSVSDQASGYKRMRAVIRAMLASRPEQVEAERREMLKASFDRMFGMVARRTLEVIEEELQSTKQAVKRTGESIRFASGPLLRKRATKSGNGALTSNGRIADARSARAKNPRW